ncbi:acyl carrier protein [Streptomyces chartreusis]|uniref:acyl carrier protein n=1 Tax=Streptomyces chartreusis TaxID=1969 RepID=UPI0038042264
MKPAFEYMRELLVTRFGIESEAIDAGTSFEELDLDSYSLAELIVTLEDTFAVRVGSEITLESTLGELAVLLEPDEKGASITRAQTG